MKNIMLLTVFLVALMPLTSFGFSGMLSTADGGVIGTGIWADNFKISWDIEQQVDNSWFYEYTITDLDGYAIDPGALSHWVVEVSPDVTEADFWDFNGSPHELGCWEDAPEITNGIKLDYGAEGQTVWSFYSTRIPTWGDFYAKDGYASDDPNDHTLNSAINAGYYSLDPIGAADGSIDGKILRPDTGVVPEPGTILLLGIGLAGTGIMRKIRK